MAYSDGALFHDQGLGLGMGVDLSLYHAIAQDNGGTLTLCKDSKNTCFRLILRLNPNSANQRVDGTSSEAVTNETKGRRWPRNDGVRHTLGQCESLFP
jgi:hypothetical protein